MRAGRIAGNAVETAAKLALGREVDGIVTAPAHKHALHLAGFPYPGHTEWLAHLAGDVDVAMMLAAEGRLDGAIAFHGLVRYDAYNEMSGRQSTSIALLDSSGSGIVISSIHHRDQARLYAKQVVGGRAELELSPEEEEAMRAALAGEAPEVGERQRRRSSS